MTRRFVTFFLLAISSACGLFAQVTTSVIIRTPTPASLAEWQRDRSLFQIILFNPAGAPEYRDARISFTVREAGGSKIVAQSQDNSAAIPRFTIPAGASTTIRTGADIFNEQSISVDLSLRSVVATTNSLPEGNYEFCIRVFDSKNNEISSGGELCRLFSIIIPDPPSLILPANNSTLPYGIFPIFSWAPVQTMGRPIRFTLRIAPIFDGQTPRSAIDGNPILFEKSGILGVSYQYSPAQPKFSLYPDAIGFAWQIQAFDLQNKPATRNNGKSEIFSFRFDSDALNNGKLNGDLYSGNSTNLGTGSTNLDSTGSKTQIGSGTSENRISHIIIGQFALNLDKPIICKGECVIDGSGKIYVDLLRDSVAVRFSDLAVRRSVLGSVAISGEVAAQLPVSRRFRFNAAELEIASLRWTPSSTFFSGNCAIDWSELGLGGGIGRVKIENADISPDEIPLQTKYLALYRSGREVGFGECIALNFDSLNFAVSSQKIFTGNMLGAASLTCLETPDGNVNGRFALSLDKPDAANLLIPIQTSVRNVQLPGVPISFSTDKFLLDLSPEANFAALVASNSCLYAESWSNPLWRGIIIPNGHFALVTGAAKSIDFSAQNVLLEPTQNGELALSLKSIDTRAQRTNIGGFRLALDTVAIEICHQTTQSAKLSGKIFLPESLKLPSSATGFDKIAINITADEHWNWRGIFEAYQPADLPFGKYATAKFSRGTASLLSTDKGIIEWTDASILPTNTDTSISIAGLKITADGTLKFGQNGWKSIAPAANTEIAGLPIAANEIGIGYGESDWWFGISGTLQLPEESGLSAGGGIKIKRLRILGNDEIDMISDEVAQTISAGKNLDMSGSFRIGAIRNSGFGLIGRPSAIFHSIGNSKLTVEFALGKSNGRLFWYAIGADVFPEPLAFAQSFSLFGGAFGAGWNIALDHCDSSSVENTSIISTPQITFTESAFSIRAGLLIGEPSRRLIRLAATAVNPGGTTPGTLSDYLEITGNAIIHPEFGFARGYVTGQLAGTNASLRLTGTASLNFPGATFDAAGLSVASDANTPAIKFNGISGQLALFEKFDKDNNNASSAVMQCSVRNATLAVSVDEAKFNGIIEPLIAICGSSSSGTTGYIIGKGEASPCMRLLFTQSNTSATMDFATFYRHEGNALAGLDALPCAGSLSVSSAGNLAKRHRHNNGVWELQPIVSTSDCGAATMSVFASSSAAVQRHTRAEIHETTLRTAENQSVTISFPTWNDILETEPPNVRIAASFAGKSWEFEQNAPVSRSCDEIASARAEAVENCDITPIIKSSTYAIRNIGTNTIAQGNRIAISLTFEVDGKKIYADTIIELERSLPPQSEYHIEIKKYIAKIDKISGAVLSVRTIAPLVDTNSLNNCIAIGSMTCQK